MHLCMYKMPLKSNRRPITPHQPCSLAPPERLPPPKKRLRSTQKPNVLTLPRIHP